MTSPEVAQSSSLYLTLDQGGHAGRALVFDSKGHCVAQAEAPCAVLRQGDARVEHDAEALVSGLQDCLIQVTTRLGARATHIVAAALVTQRSSVVCWDRVSGAALTPVLSWQDRRAQQWLQQFNDAAPRIHAITGLRLSAHYGASKLRWCLDHVPAVQTALHDGRLACGPLAAFLLFRLLTERPLLVDSGNAARTLLLNLHSRTWDPELAALFGVPIACLPRCVPNRYTFGTLPLATHAVPLTFCHGDQPAALFAAGAPRSDRVYINIGTGAFVQRLLEHDPGDIPDLLTTLLLDDGATPSYALEGTVNGAASAIDAMGFKLGLDAKTLMTQLSLWLEQCENPPLFLNGISGLGSPFWVADFKSRFVGAGEPAECMVAVVESIVFLLQSNLAAMEHHVTPASVIVVSGGLAMLDGLCQRLATLSGRPVQRLSHAEATARGAAWLLADTPLDWADDSKVVEFAPVDDAPLQVRFQRWRAVLDEHIAAG